MQRFNSMKHFVWTLILVSCYVLTSAQHCAWDNYKGMYVGFKTPGGKTVHISGQLVFFDANGDTVFADRPLTVCGKSQQTNYSFNTASAKNLCKDGKPVLEEVISMYSMKMTSFNPVSLRVILDSAQSFEFKGYSRVFDLKVDQHDLADLCTGHYHWNSSDEGVDSLRSKIRWITVYPRVEGIAYYVKSVAEVNRLLPQLKNVDLSGFEKAMTSITAEQFESSAYLIVGTRFTYNGEEWKHNTLMRGPMVIYNVWREVNSMEPDIENEPRQKSEDRVFIMPVEPAEKDEVSVNFRSTVVLE